MIDFEGSARTGVVEYGIVEIRKGAIGRCHSRLCAPVAALNAQDTRLHGIRQADAAESPAFADEWGIFSRWRGEGVFGAHHAAVEQGLLKGQWAYPPASPDHLTGGEIADWGPWVDTRRLYEVIYPDLETYQLMALVERFGLQSQLDEAATKYCEAKRRKAHCALYDALASALLLLHLLAEDGFEEATIAWLLEHSLPSQAKKQAARQGDLFS